MSHAILLDANLLIGAFDGQPENETHQLAVQKIKELLNDPEAKLAITPLIRYEVLRGAKDADRAKALAEALNGFVEFEIDGKVGHLAADIFRFSVQQKVPLNKRQFDLLHYASAQVNQLSFESQDGDIPKIRELHKNMNT